MASKKIYRIQRWSPSKDDWIFWLNEIYDDVKDVVAEVQTLNSERSYIIEGIHFRYVETGKQRGYKETHFMANPYQRIIKIHGIPPTIPPAVHVGSL